MHTFIAIDCETTGLDYRAGHRPFAVSTCDQSGNTTYHETPVNPNTRLPTQSVRQFFPTLEAELRHYDRIVMHNAKFDFRMLGLRPHYWSRIDDTRIMSHVLDPLEPHGLKELAAQYAHIPDTDESILKDAVRAARKQAKRQGFDISRSTVGMDYWLPKALDPSCHLLEDYAVADAIRTAALYKIFSEALDQEHLRPQYQRELTLLPIIYRLEEAGIRLRPKVLTRRIQELTLQVENLTFGIQGSALNYFSLHDFNARSTPQLRQLLYHHLSLSPRKWTARSGEPSTDRETLQAHLAEAPDGSIAHLILSELCQRSRLETALSYLRSYQEAATPAHRVHTDFNTTGTSFTRLSSSSPNLQNVGSRDEELSLREVFGPTPGYDLFGVDYNQLELRIGAKLSQDARMLAALGNNEDLHQVTADALGVPRKQAKNINFAWWYGAGINKLSTMAGIDADEFFERMNATYPGVLAFMQTTTAQVNRDGHVFTAYGYRCQIHPDRAYVGVNARVQGTAGDIVKNAMIYLDAYLKHLDTRFKKYTMVLNIHDELLFELSHAFNNRLTMQRIARVMELAGRDLGIHTPVEITHYPANWAKGKTVPRRQLHPDSERSLQRWLRPVRNDLFAHLPTRQREKLWKERA